MGWGPTTGRVGSRCAATSCARPLADDRLRVLGDGRVPMHCIGLNTIIAVQMATPGKLVTPSKGTRGVFGT